MADKSKVVQHQVIGTHFRVSSSARSRSGTAEPRRPVRLRSDARPGNRRNAGTLRVRRDHVGHARSGYCALGGSSRYIATACDCRVTGIDLTEEFIDAARELTSRCGLENKIEYFHANALDTPFEDATFDHVWCHNVTMNIEDKAGLVAEIARVLKPRGRFSCAEITRGTGGEPFYPLPWASDPSSSFLVTANEMRAILESGGFRVVERIGLTEPNMAYRREVKERAKRGEPPLSVNPMYFKYGDVFLERGQNVDKSAEDGRLAEQLIVAEKA